MSFNVFFACCFETGISCWLCVKIMHVMYHHHHHHHHHYHHHSQGVSLSLRMNSSLHALHNFLSFAMWLHVGLTYRIKSSHHLGLDRPRGLLCPRGIHSVTDCPSIVMSPRHVTVHLCLLSRMLLIMFVTALCLRIQFVLFLSLGVTPTMIFSIFLWVVTSFLSWVLLRDQGSEPYVMTGSTHSLNPFLLVSLAHFCLAWCCPAYRMHSIPVRFSFSFFCIWSWSLVTIWPRYTYLSTSSIFFPSTITSSLLACLLHITLCVTLWCITVYVFSLVLIYSL